MIPVIDYNKFGFKYEVPVTTLFTEEFHAAVSVAGGIYKNWVRRYNYGSI